MNYFVKILLSIPSIVGTIYMITFWNIDVFKWITNNIVEFSYQTPIVNGLVLIQIGYLIYRLWNYKNVAKNIKTKWTVFLALFNFVSSLFFIWKKDNELQQLNVNNLN